VNCAYMRLMTLCRAQIEQEHSNANEFSRAMQLVSLDNMSTTLCFQPLRIDQILSSRCAQTEDPAIPPSMPPRRQAPNIADMIGVQI
jgi:hypothetical protein